MKITSHYLVADPNPGLTPPQIERARKAVIARRNAMLSTGPLTEEGKAKAAQNARKHGFAGAAVVIEDEDKAAFAAHLDSYFETFQPINQPERDQVRKIACSQWRYDRLLSIESGLLDLELVHRKPTIDAFLDNMEPQHYAAISFQELTNAGNALDLCQRYLNQASRETDRAIRTFYLLKQNRAESQPTAPPPQPQQNQPERNEPTPSRPATPETPSQALPVAASTTQLPPAHPGTGGSTPKIVS